MVLVVLVVVVMVVVVVVTMVKITVTLGIIPVSIARYDPTGLWQYPVPPSLGYSWMERKD